MSSFVAKCAEQRAIEEIRQRRASMLVTSDRSKSSPLSEKTKYEERSHSEQEHAVCQQNPPEALPLTRAYANGLWGWICPERGKLSLVPRHQFRSVQHDLPSLFRLQSRQREYRVRRCLVINEGIDRRDLLLDQGSRFVKPVGDPRRIP